jgi:hypothetical protein
LSSAYPLSSSFAAGCAAEKPRRGLPEPRVLCRTETKQDGRMAVLFFL